jgi:3-dehydroquinate synthase class II
MEKIYLVSAHKGEYDDYRYSDICAFQHESWAQEYKNRMLKTIIDLHDFYNAEADRIWEEAGKPFSIIELPDEIFDVWKIYVDKKEKYYGVTVTVTPIELRTPRFFKSKPQK